MVGKVVSTGPYIWTLTENRGKKNPHTQQTETDLIPSLDERSQKAINSTIIHAHECIHAITRSYSLYDFGS